MITFRTTTSISVALDNLVPQQLTNVGIIYLEIKNVLFYRAKDENDNFIYKYKGELTYYYKKPIASPVLGLNLGTRDETLKKLPFEIDNNQALAIQNMLNLDPATALTGDHTQNYLALIKAATLYKLQADPLPVFNINPQLWELDG